MYLHSLLNSILVKRKMTIQEAHTQLNSSLGTIYEAREASNIAAIIFEDAFKVTNFKRQDELDNFQIERLEMITERLLKKEPWQYVLGEADFYDLKLKVNRNVLIPRPETEELVELALAEMKIAGSKSVLDIGTGSGCIPIALKYKRKDLEVAAIDISGAALLLAGMNARKYRLEIDFFQTDILDLDQRITLPKYDCIISNPPYILTGKEQNISIADNVHNYEPHIALYVEEGKSPLLFYENIIEFAKTNLNSGGLILFEFNEFYSEQLSKLMQDSGLSQVEIFKDMNGRYRMAKGKLA